MSNLIVITGGPFSGKTTMIEALAHAGFGTVAEAGIMVINELSAQLGIEAQARWRHAHRTEFQVQVLERQIELERDALAHEKGPIFLDRSRHDGLAYCRHFGAEPPPELLAALTEVRYDHVIVLDTLAHVHVRTASGRTSDRATSLALRGHLIDVYRDYGYEPAVVPEMPVDARLDAVRALAGLEPA